MINLRTLSCINKNKIVDYILLIFNRFSDYPTNFVLTAFSTCGRLFQINNESYKEKEQDDYKKIHYFSYR